MATKSTAHPAGSTRLINEGENLLGIQLGTLRQGEGGGIRPDVGLPQ